MTVVMERVNVSRAGGHYRVIATTRASTAERELQETAKAGFRIAAAPQSPNEWLFVLQEIAGGSPLFQYRFVELRQDSTDDELRRAEADGYRAVAGVDRIAVLEKLSAP
jgi:hypothetical protein